MPTSAINSGSDTNLNIGFIASYNASGMRSVLNAVENGLAVKPTVLICNNKNANAFKLAKEYDLPAYHLSSKTHEDNAELDQAICDRLQQHEVDLILLSGYMKKLGPKMLSMYRNKILNIHPSLLPLFGGKGMYGDHVHQAVLDNNAKKTGATVHIVTAEYDQGPILNQQSVALENNESLDNIREKVRQIEAHLYVDTLQGILSGDIEIPQSDK
ncbi:MAG: phosphoribosylglycinamide formyltransferase [Gammaproteobacteria bacterium]